jgi:hypothetical protein
MKQSIKMLAFGLFFFSTTHASANQNYLQACWLKQVQPIQEKFLTFSYTGTLNLLDHGEKPWDQSNYTVKGKVWTNTFDFIKNDTLLSMASNKTYYSKMQLDKTDLLLIDNTEQTLSRVTQSAFLDAFFETARHSPVRLIHYFYTQGISISSESDADFAIYQTTINKTIVKLYINQSTNLLSKVTMLKDENFYGDLAESFTYFDFAQIEQVYFPKTIKIDKINGKVQDEVNISAAFLSHEPQKLIERPIDFKFSEGNGKKTGIEVVHYADNIHLVNLIETNDRSMIVEFNDFLVVAEAPEGSKVGELIIAEARKIAPNKPIKYFAFGHFHQHYIGGLRAFIHKGATIICTKGDEEYVQYLHQAKHTLNPDSLALQPKALKTEEIKDSLTITDGQFVMKIYLIGAKSEHTNDYLIYYFPSLKLLFQDDSVGIKVEGEIKKASKRQAAIYNAIKEHNLDVKTIIQSWPLSYYGLKSIIPFEDLEKSVIGKY